MVDILVSIWDRTLHITKFTKLCIRPSVISLMISSCEDKKLPALSGFCPHRMISSKLFEENNALGYNLFMENLAEVGEA